MPVLLSPPTAAIFNGRKLKAGELIAVPDHDAKSLLAAGWVEAEPEPDHEPEPQPEPDDPATDEEVDQ
jgi:hypothetical protein